MPARSSLRRTVSGTQDSVSWISPSKSKRLYIVPRHKVAGRKFRTGKNQHAALCLEARPNDFSRPPACNGLRGIQAPARVAAAMLFFTEQGAGPPLLLVHGLMVT